MGSHDPSESRRAYICVPLSAEKLQPVLRDHHGKDTKDDQTPQGPVEALCDDTTQALGRRDHSIANIDASDSTKDEGCRQGDQQAPRAQHLDDEIRLPEQPERKEQRDRVQQVRAQHVPAWELHARENTDGDSENHGLEKDAEESIRKAKDPRLPRLRNRGT